MPTPPSFGDLTYWNTRFTTESNFEWLLDFPTLKPYLQDTITHQHENKTQPQILHIGSGSSDLGSQIRHLVTSPSQVHNVDFSDVAVQRGQQMGDGTRWSRLDLLDIHQVLAFSRQEEQQYDVVLDKSTSDAIACAADVAVRLPYPVRSVAPATQPKSGDGMVHPLYVLAVHLAFLAAPGCRWLVFSYSGDRFVFWDGDAEKKMGVVLPEGFAHPGRLWKLVRREAIEKKEEKKEDVLPAVHRPPEMHHLYVLERTTAALNI